MTKAGGKRRAESGAARRRNKPRVNGRPEKSAGPLKAVGGRGLGKAGAKRLGQMLKRVIQDDRNSKGKETDQLPTTPIRLLKHKAQTIVQTPVSKGRTQAAAPRVSALVLEVISQCKRRGGMSMQELKQALAAGGYDVTKNNARVNLAMRGLVRKETIVQTAGQDSFKINKKKPTAEKSGRIRAKRKKDAEKKSASKRPKPAGKYDEAGQKQQRKRATAAVRSPKTVKKGVKAQSQARKNTKKTQKVVTNTKRKSQHKVVHSR
ncbi:histone H1-like [Colossoma macropomum]|uniref:histone H1-like n=1 Tax=Colossoma macropomum TaxID=42526 RepID=UPI001864E6A9|nr:histone H1-like [Colossoma macropomum]